MMFQISSQLYPKGLIINISALVLCYGLAPGIAGEMRIVVKTKAEEQIRKH